jgi:HPr kinase/phosphorylase
MTRRDEAEMSGSTLLVHGTTVALDGGAVLLRGPSGIGKSDLALRLIDRGARLVADDQTVLRRAGDRLVASAPATIAGLLEIRGVGIEAVERLPEPRSETVLGLAIPLVALVPHEASSPAKLRFVLRNLARVTPPAILGR